MARSLARAALLLALFLPAALLAPPAAGDEAKQPEKKPPEKSAWQKAIEGTTLHKGFLDLRVKDGTVYAELDAKSYDRDFVMMTSISRGIGARWVYSGLTLDDYLMTFRRASGDKVHLVRRETRYRAAPGTPLERAVKMSFSDAVVASVPVVAKDGGKVLIDLGRIFLSDWLELAPHLGRGLRGSFSFDANKSQWGPVKTFEKNTELRVEAVYSGREGAGGDVVPDPRGVSIVVHYTLRDISDLKGYQPRLADDRVGYFLTAHKNFSGEGPDPFVRYVNRWRLDKADPDAARSAPVRPIVMWLENTIPYKYRRWIREGIEAWNVAFEEAGFVNAIEVRQMPDDADWDPEDARYNTFRWVTSHELSYGAIGPSRVNPLTGEILDADILFESEMVRGYANVFSRYTPREAVRLLTEEGDTESPLSERLFARGHCTLGLHRMEEAALGGLAFHLLPPRPFDIPEEYVGAMLRSVAMHEVGHTLGLRHNFKGSTFVPNERLHDSEWTRQHGLSGSTMDYLPINFAEDPKEQGEYFESRVGPYDVWAIRYGYTPLPGDTWKEWPALQKIAAESVRPGHAYGTDEDAMHNRPVGWGMDPHTTTDDLGADMLAYVRSRLRLLDKLMAADWNRLASETYGWVPVRDGVERVINARGAMLAMVLKHVGGVHARRHHPGSETEEEPLEAVDPARQRDALTLVVEQGFAEDAWKVPPALMRKLAPSRWSHWGSQDRQQERLDWSLSNLVAQKQDALLEALLLPVVQGRILDNRLRMDDEASAVTLDELYGRLTDAIFSEFQTPDRAVLALRRRLQVEWVSRMRRIVLGEGPFLPEESRNQAHATLEALRERLAGATPSDLSTRAHVRRLLAQVTSALEAESALRR